MAEFLVSRYLKDNDYMNGLQTAEMSWVTQYYL